MEDHGDQCRGAIADNACADRFVLGPAVAAPWRDTNLAAYAALGVNGTVVHEGRGGNVLGDPHIALTWLVNDLGRHGITLGEGEIVTTGACVVTTPTTQERHSANCSILTCLEPALHRSSVATWFAG